MRNILLLAPLAFVVIPLSAAEDTLANSYRATISAVDQVLPYQAKVLRITWSYEKDVTLENEDAVKHGREQLSRLLADRPLLAQHIKPDDLLYRWISFLFAGGGTTRRVFWNGDRQFKDLQGARAATFPGQTVDTPSISVVTSDNDRSFDHDELWVAVVFELHNAILNQPYCWELATRVREGQITKKDFVRELAASEFNSVCATRLFYRHVFLRWAEKVGAVASPDVWRFGDPLTLKEWLAPMNDLRSYPWVP